MGLPSQGKSSDDDFGTDFESGCDCVHLVDMGMCTPIVRSSSMHFSPSAGSLLFASRAQHRGSATLPEDDMESLCYCLAYLLTGKLPWSSAGYQFETEVVATKKEEMVGVGDAEDAVHLLIGEAAGTSAVALSIANLWCVQEQRRAERSDESSTLMEQYAYEAEWPAACRAALAGLGSIEALKAEAYDWSGAGVTWTAEGELLKADTESFSEWTSHV
mmetsp:Transcript_81334/g.141808  ORF Transcript_81334/g.141808 Transcript_81334/m.141808 type:complete len:217 (-) Transcript_81334:427-1077(-)